MEGVEDVEEDDNMLGDPPNVYLIALRACKSCTDSHIHCLYERSIVNSAMSAANLLIREMLSLIR